MKRSKVKGKCLIKIKTMPEMISYPKATVAFDFVFGKKTLNQSEDEGNGCRGLW